MSAIVHRRRLAHFERVDPVMAALAREIGPCALPHRALASPFQHLFTAIIAQQISGAAATTIQHRVLTTLGVTAIDRLEPATLLDASTDRLRTAGLSSAKIRAVLDLAEKTLQGIVPASEVLEPLPDAAIIDRLTVVRGVGPWTVQMMLMFQLGRPDVLPVADYGIRNGFRIAYRRRSLPSLTQLAQFGARWAPYRSAAAWYLWRAVDRDRELARSPSPKTARASRRARKSSSGSRLRPPDVRRGAARHRVVDPHRRHNRG